MARTSSLILLVNSLTKAEKRYFRLYTSLQKGNKNYLDLFEILGSRSFKKAADLKQEFKTIHPTASFEITSKYLYSILMETLLHLKNSQQDETVMMNNYLSIAKILFEKSLYSEGFNELKKLKKLAAKKENYLIHLSAIRLELHYRNQLNFQEMSENELIQNQMKVNTLIRSITSMHQHLSLYELLRHRHIYKGSVRTPGQKQELNDLVVSELSLMSKLSHNTFEINKIHLLFQSSYCLNVGDYRSGLNAFYELYKLFENNRHLWEESAMDYLSCLEGILDSLHTIQKHDEIDFYIDKVSELKTKSHLFSLQKYRIIFIYKVLGLTGRGLYIEALGLISEFKDKLFKNIHILGANKQAELYFYIALVYFGNSDMSGAIKYLNKVLLDNYMYYKLPEYKTFRLIRLLAHYELSNLDFVQYEISSFKRQMSNRDKTFLLEKLILRFIQKSLFPLSSKERLALWNKLQPSFDKVKSDKFEIQILKMFDFKTWVESKLCKKPFIELLQKNTSHQAFSNV